MKRIFAILLSAVIVLSSAVTAYASDCSTYTNDVNKTNTVFTISNSGSATVKNTYYGMNGAIKSAKIVTKIQKKVGIIWVNVDGCTWTDNTNATNYSKTYKAKLSSKGNYRAHVVFTVTGTNGKNDKITKNVEKVYS